MSFYNGLCSQECWDKDRFSDDFMGSVQFSEEDLAKFQVQMCVCVWCVCMCACVCVCVTLIVQQDGPKWCRLDHVKTGELLLGIKKIVHREVSMLPW